MEGQTTRSDIPSHSPRRCVSAGVTRQGCFDRQLAALMIRENSPVILTENAADFMAIDGITPIDPFA